MQYHRTTNRSIALFWSCCHLLSLTKEGDNKTTKDLQRFQNSQIKQNNYISDLENEFLIRFSFTNRTSILDQHQSAHISSSQHTKVGQRNLLKTTPWKLNGWNPMKRKGEWSEPNLHEDVFHVNLQVCNHSGKNILLKETPLFWRSGHLVHLVNIIDVYCPRKKLKWFFGVVTCAAIWDATCFSCGGKSPAYQPFSGRRTRSIQLENVSSIPFDDQRKASNAMKVVASFTSQLQGLKIHPQHTLVTGESTSIFEHMVIFFEATLTFFGCH